MSETNGIDEVSRLQTQPPGRFGPLPKNNKPYPVSEKVEMGTSDFFSIKDPQIFLPPQVLP